VNMMDNYMHACMHGYNETLEVGQELYSLIYIYSVVQICIGLQYAAPP